MRAQRSAPASATMTTGPIALGPYVEARLEYDLWLSTGSQSPFTVAASIDGKIFYGLVFYGTTNGFEPNSIDLLSWPYLGDLTQHDRVWFRFGYSSPPNEVWQGPFIDNLRIEVLSPREVFHDTFVYGDTTRWTLQVP